MRSTEYEAYPVVFYGYGPQHAWLRLMQGKLSSEIRRVYSSPLNDEELALAGRFFNELARLYRSQLGGGDFQIVWMGYGKNAHKLRAFTQVKVITKPF